VTHLPVEDLAAEAERRRFSLDRGSPKRRTDIYRLDVRGAPSRPTDRESR
jgi:hypothetical protein